MIPESRRTLAEPSVRFRSGDVTERDPSTRAENRQGPAFEVSPKVATADPHKTPTKSGREKNRHATAREVSPKDRADRFAPCVKEDVTACQTTRSSSAPDRRPREAVVQRAIELALGAEPDLILMRSANGVARNVDENGHERFTRMGLPNGAPDLIGILAPSGRLLGLECKRPGEHATAEQARVHALWRRFGAHVTVVHSAAEARAALSHARKETLAMPYVIDDTLFVRKRDVAAHCSAMLKRGALTRDEERFVRELLNGHPDHARIVGPGLTAIRVGTSGFGDPCFVADRTDTRRVAFSFVTCITARFETDNAPEAA